MLCVDEGVFQLITEAAVPQQHADWSSSGPDESCSMELLSAFPPFLSACAQPAYTNYVGGFHGCLDYIFIQPDKMQVLIGAKGAARVAPPPSEIASDSTVDTPANKLDYMALNQQRYFAIGVLRNVRRKRRICQVNNGLRCCYFVQVEQVIPLPSHQEITTHEALPSVAHPSDHIALVCDLLWTPARRS